MSSESKTSFDLEPNPFERSFATDKDTPGSSSSNNANRHNLRIPNISSLNLPSNKLPGITPTGFTPADRKLPPLSLSPGANSAPGTPGSNLWNSLLNATGSGHPPGSAGARQQGAQGQQQQPLLPPNQNGAAGAANGAAPNAGLPSDAQYSNQNFNQFVSNLRKTGLTPNESNLRSGLTPGGAAGFPFGNTQLPGLTTPSAFLNSPMTPGLSSLLGMASNQVNSMHQNPTGATPLAQQTHLQPPIQQVQQQQQQQPQQQQQQPQQGPILNNSGPLNSIPSTIDEAAETKPTKKTETKKRKASIDKEPVAASKTAANKKKKTETGVKKEKGAKNASPKNKWAKEDVSDEKENTEDVEGSPVGTEEEKRKVFLERNRVAASKCRQRKKQLIQKMEDELSYYSTGYRELSGQVTELKNHLATMRNIFQGHKDCPVFLNSVGGFDNFNNILQQTNYLCQVSGNGANTMSIPSTIPTTLNNAQDVAGQQSIPQIQPQGQGPPQQQQQQVLVQQQPQQAQLQQPQQQHQPIQGPQRLVQGQLQNQLLESNPSTIHDTASSVQSVGGGSSENIPTNSSNFSQNNGSGNVNGITSHQSLTDLPSAANGMSSGVAPPHGGETSYVRTINSMSNLAQAYQRNTSEVDGNEFNLRSGMNMSDQQLQQQPQHQKIDQSVGNSGQVQGPQLQGNQGFLDGSNNVIQIAHN